MVVDLETEKDLEDEHMRGASVFSLFSFSLFSSIQVLMSERQVFLEKILNVWWIERETWSCVSSRED